jgi:hypothetical protein
MQRGGRPLQDDVITQPNKDVVMQRGARPLYGDVGIIIQRGGRSLLRRHATGR